MLNHRLDRTHPTTKIKALAVALLLVGIAVPAASFRAAQGASALTGTVYDPTGAVLPQVDVALVDEKHTRRRVATDGAGRFEFDQVAAGRYLLETSLLGFASVRQEFALAEPADWNRSITMQVGTLQETISVTATRPSALAAPAQNGRPIGGNIRVPVKLVDKKPVYPAAMRESGLEGTVLLDASIGPDGNVLSAKVASPQVHPDFAAAAIEAVRHWRFSPTLLNGSAIEVSMRVSVRFSLTDEQ
jgi:TonB family protein